MNLLSFDEPFLKLVNQGMILAPAYTYEGNYVSLEDVVNKDDKYYCEMENGNFVPVQEVGIVKVSKSFKNTISPTKIIKQYGEAARLYIASNPIETDMEWSTEDINGCAKFLRKIENIKEVESKPASDAFKDLMNEATNNLNMLKFNCYVANIRSMMNMWTNSDIELGYLLVFLYPTCPVTTSNVYKNIFKREIEDRLWYTEDRLVKSHKKISVYMGNKFFFDMESVDEKTDLANALARLKNPSYNSFVYKFGNILKFI
jgi:leucyl-tRNA synthetase